jgi:hypothetical protein
MHGAKVKVVVVFIRGTVDLLEVATDEYQPRCVGMHCTELV